MPSGLREFETENYLDDLIREIFKWFKWFKCFKIQLSNKAYKTPFGPREFETENSSNDS